MLTIQDVLETNQMIQKNNLDVRTITMGISLLDCCASDGKTLCNNIYDKITKYGEHLVETGEAISREYGVPIINKRVSVTPISPIILIIRNTGIKKVFCSGRNSPHMYGMTHRNSGRILRSCFASG